MATRYERVAEVLRNRITAGYLRPGDRLPSEKQLAAQWGVSSPTVRQAMDLLEAEGLIEKKHGRGTFVRVPRRRMTYVGGQCRPDVLPPGVDLQVRVKTAEVAATGHLSSLLQVPERTLVTEYLYVGRYEGTPYSVAHVYLPRRVPGFVPPTDSQSPSCEDIRARLSAAGVQLAATIERVTARPPTPDEAEALELTVSTGVLVLERTTTDSDGHVVEGTLLVLPSDRTEAVFTTHLAPSKQLEGALND